MASELGFDLESIMYDSINKAYCLETTDKFPIKSYVPKLMPKIEINTPREWNENIDLTFIRNFNCKFNKSENVTLKNYIDINIDFDNLIFEDFEMGDNIYFKFKDKDIKKLYFENKRSSNKTTDKAVLFVNDSVEYEDGNYRYHVTLNSKEGNIKIETSNKTFKGSIKSINLDQKNNCITISNGNSKIILDGTNVIVEGNLIFNSNTEDGDNNE